MDLSLKNVLCVKKRYKIVHKTSDMVFAVVYNIFFFIESIFILVQFLGQMDALLERVAKTIYPSRNKTCCIYKLLDYF